MYIKGSIENTAAYMSERFPDVLVTGPRQVGKTTMLREIADAGRTHLSLDNLLITYTILSSHLKT